MGSLSISRAWDETKAVLGRDAGLIVAVGLALFVLPQTIAGLVAPAPPRGQMAEPGWWTVLALLALLVGVVGQLAVVRLALAPPTSVAEAIRLAVRRAPTFFGALLIYGLPFLVALLAILGMRSSGGNGALALAVLIFLLILIPVAVRVQLSSAVAVAEAGGPLAILRRSLELTRGHTLRLIGVLLLFFLVFGIALAAYELVIGSLVLLTVGQPEPMSVARLVKLLVSNLGETAILLVFLVLVARIYAQLASGALTVPKSGT
jgi:hypothetical protein